VTPEEVSPLCYVRCAR